MSGLRWFCLLILLLPAYAHSDQAADGYDHFCGRPRRVRAFTVEDGGERYTLPAYVRIQRAGVTLFEDPSPSEWLSPYKGVRFSSFGKYLLLQTFEQDCVDVYDARLFMISPDGQVIHQPIWTSNWNAGFFVNQGKLTYWSDWFCQTENRERNGGESYVYVFSEEKRAFERMNVSPSVFCSHVSRIDFLRFQEAQAEWE